MKELSILCITVVGILFIPLIGMQFTDEINWTVGDFVIAGALLSGAGLAIIAVYKLIKNKMYLSFAILGILLLLFWVYVELAVGIFF